MNAFKLTLSTFAFVAIAQNYAYSAKLNNTWFQSKASECDMYVDKDLHLKDAPPLNLSAGAKGGEVGIGIPMQLRKVFAPGYGKCCLFDREGNLMEGKFEERKTMSGAVFQNHLSGSGRVSKGNDECESWLKRTRNAVTAGLWWCVGEQTNCHMDWWRIKK